jgi:hypothetical protein
MRRCPPTPPEPMHSEELTARLHEIADAIDRRADVIENMAKDRGNEERPMILVGVKAIRDDALLIHSTADALTSLGADDPTFVAVLAPVVGKLFEERRRA